MMVRPNSPDSIVDVAAVIERATEKAVAVKNLKGQLVWLPRSLIEVEQNFESAVLTMPQWLAEREELV